MPCDMSVFFERIGEVWAVRSRDGKQMLPIFFCPFCGEKIKYKDYRKKESEE